MKKRIIRLGLVSLTVGTILYFSLGAGLAGGFGMRLPDGSIYDVRFQVGIQHIPPPKIEAGIMQLIPPGEAS